MRARARERAVAATRVRPPAHLPTTPVSLCCRSFAPDCAAFHGDDGLHALLAVPEVQAVIVVLPPQVIDGAIMEALAAGKHVLSEKPAAATLAAAQRVLEFQRSLPHAPLWCVAENYRSEEVRGVRCRGAGARAAPLTPVPAPPPSRAF